MNEKTSMTIKYQLTTTISQKDETYPSIQKKKKQQQQEIEVKSESKSE